jgi:hypothetical protein
MTILQKTPHFHRKYLTVLASLKTEVEKIESSFPRSKNLANKTTMIGCGEGWRASGGASESWTSGGDHFGWIQVRKGTSHMERMVVSSAPTHATAMAGQR